MREKWTRVIFAFHIIRVCVLSYAFWWMACGGNYYRDYDLITVTNDAVRSGGILSGYLIFTLESYRKRPIQRKLWTNYQRIQREFNHFDCAPSYNGFTLKFVQTFVVLAYFHTRSCFRFINERNRIDFDYVVFYFGLTFIQKIRHFHYLFFIQLLDQQLNLFVMELKSKCTQNRLKRIRIHYDLLYELSECINEMFGWSNVMSFPYLLVRLALDLSWIFWLIYKHQMDCLSTFLHPFCILSSQ